MLNLRKVDIFLNLVKRSIRNANFVVAYGGALVFERKSVCINCNLILFRW